MFFLWNQQQGPNSAVSYPNLSYGQAQKYNNLFKQIDNIENNEKIKIINFNYTYQYFHKSTVNNNNQKLIENLLEEDKKYEHTYNKHLKYLPISYIHGEAVGNRYNDNSLPRCIIGFNKMNNDKNSILELSKSFKTNLYAADLNMDMFFAKYYKLYLPNLSILEHLDIVFFGHSLGENDWLYFKEIFNKYNLKNNANFKIYFLFEKSIFNSESSKTENIKKIKSLFDWYFNENSDLWVSEHVICKYDLF